MRLIAFLTDPSSSRDVLDHLGEPEPIPDHAPRGAHEMDQTRSWSPDT